LIVEIRIPNLKGSTKVSEQLENCSSISWWILW